jgi:hypothetical protein
MTGGILATRTPCVSPGWLLNRFPKMMPKKRFADCEVPRVVYDETDGTSWRVVELDTSETPGARRATCLLFMSSGGFRRVWNYPSDWADLSPEQLMQLGRVG